MLHLNRKTEYACMALVMMMRSDDVGFHPVSSREISEAYQIPSAALSKVLQSLASHGIIKSIQGPKGGYVLGKPAQDISLLSVFAIFESDMAVADCMKEEKITCPQWMACSIKEPFSEMNKKIYEVISEFTVKDLNKERNFQLGK